VSQPRETVDNPKSKTSLSSAFSTAVCLPKPRRCIVVEAVKIAVKNSCLHSSCLTAPPAGEHRTARRPMAVNKPVLCYCWCCGCCRTATAAAAARIEGSSQSHDTHPDRSVLSISYESVPRAVCCTSIAYRRALLSDCSHTHTSQSIAQ
jgi:hypothetical protein